MPTAEKPAVKAVPDAPRRYKVFVSSTYLDNRERRKVVQDAITMAGMVWHGMDILPASTHTTVEECLRYAGEADVLVGIIAWRYGWIPENCEKSITEMEYDAAKERLMFVLDSALPVNPENDYDPKPERWTRQAKLDAFKERMSKDQMQALFNEKTLQAKVLTALQDWRQRREGPPPPPPVDDLIEEIRGYCRKADALHATLPVAGFVTQLKVPIDIEEIYIPLRAMVDLRGVGEACFADADDAEKALLDCDAALEIDLPEAFWHSAMRGRRGLVILGDPGAGKTTHLKRLVLWCLRKGPETIDLPAGMLPVFLPLRDLRDLDQGLDAFIEAQLDSPHLKTPPGFGERLLQRGNLLFLLDGLDEVADLSQREKVAKWIVEAVRSHPDCRFVVSSRFAGYSPGVRLSEDFLEMHIRPLSADQAERFVQNWYRIVERGLAKDPEQAEGIAWEKAENLIERLRETDSRARHVLELTRNPLLLTNICLVHRHRGSLPRKRALLYQDCIDVLLEHWRGSKRLPGGVGARDGRRVLQPAALWLHTEDGRTRAKAAELAPRIEPALKAVNWAGGSAETFLRTVRDESGLLTGWDQEHYGFMHLGFQEYLAAREIRRRAFEGDPQVIPELASHFGESWWQEVALLLLALEDPSLFTPYMREVLRQPAFTEWPNLMEMYLDDAAETSPQAFVELLETAGGSDTELWRRQFAALQVLDRLDTGAVEKLRAGLVQHPSPEISRWFATRNGQALQEVIFAERGGYELVRVPGGVFEMGSPKSEKERLDDEGPLHQVRVSDFYMGRYPVTNDQYAQFLKEYPKVAEPTYWGDRRFNGSRQPVVGVSWEDAQLYAAWAGLQLPSEAEWEYACRAGKSTRYYTGDTEEDLKRAGWYMANSGNQTHPVGEKEANGFGLYDMHGNIWEWTADDWHSNYKGAPADGRPWINEPRGSNRVIRGGGWSNFARICRSAFRDFEPGYRFNVVLGLRLSRSVALGP
jgi:formylglycine-generating enzyme required for sulfatase activity